MTKDHVLDPRGRGHHDGLDVEIGRPLLDLAADLDLRALRGKVVQDQLGPPVGDGRAAGVEQEGMELALAPDAADVEGLVLVVHGSLEEQGSALTPGVEADVPPLGRPVLEGVIGGELPVDEVPMVKASFISGVALSISKRIFNVAGWPGFTDGWAGTGRAGACVPPRPSGRSLPGRNWCGTR